MCTFHSQLPKRSKSNGTEKRKNMVLSLRPCPDKDSKQTWYRFRLLAWSAPEKNDRDDPFIERYVHQVWKKNDKGYSVIDDEVVCPVTKHVHVDGNRYDACPNCKLANQHFITWKEAKWKDREAAKKNKEIGRKYQGIVPVYVRDDPNYPQNNGQIKVIIFGNKSPSKKELESGEYNKFEYYDEFRKIVEKASQTACVFNGKQAVDCCVHVIEVEDVINEGQPNEYKFKHKVIDKITFTKPDKAYDIPAITKELVTNCGFDEEYYTAATPEELQAFYNRHYKISNDDIPEDDGVQVYETSKSTPAKSKPNSTPLAFENNAAKTDDISDSDLDDLTSSNEEPAEKSDEEPAEELTEESAEELVGDMEDSSPAEKTKPQSTATNDADVDELLKDLDI